MKHKLSKIILGIITIVSMVATGSYFAYPYLAGANVSQQLSPCQTATATTSVNYIAAGVGTTTLGTESSPCDIMASGNFTLAEKGTLKVFFTASSSALSIIDIIPQYSNNNNDWYENALGMSTTTAQNTIVLPQTFRLASNASTTIDRGPMPVLLSQATTTRIMFVQTPTRYIRFIATVPIGASAGAIWMEFQGQKEK